MLASEEAAGDVFRSLRNAGISPLLLKGASVERWLFTPDEYRISSDIDLLVSPGELAAAERQLKRLGYVNKYDGVSPGWAEEHADSWRSDAALLPVDLHRRLWGLGASPDTVWAQLWQARSTMLIGGLWCAVLGEPARALGVALHAAHHAGMERPVRDLERALEQLDEEVWEAAAALAKRLDGNAGLSVGLTLTGSGPALRDRLGLSPAAPSEIAVIPRAWSFPSTTEGFLRLRHAPGVRAKLQLIVHELFPSRDFMRLRSEEAAMANRGLRGLVAAYPVRWVRLLADVPRGLATALRTRMR